MGINYDATTLSTLLFKLSLCQWYSLNNYQMITFFLDNFSFLANSENKIILLTEVFNDVLRYIVIVNCSRDDRVLNN